ncbi:hypothetical protein [Specibacter sp. RAF43]|uniref:hypothetical protein n=1 Tax=Specibacter sp. RAF43 TaxID=3233057 RepID=UPI003F94C1D9
MGLLCPGAPAPSIAPVIDPNAAKKVAKNGSFFVGAEILSGVWQSDLARVTDCYWEISDAEGNIIENNFITLAPQFSITIPADAVGFTATGCEFHWVSE